MTRGGKGAVRSPAWQGRDVECGPRDVSLRALEAELLEAGEDSKQSELARTDMLTLSAASVVAGCSAQTLSRLRRANQVLALPLRRGRSPGYRYPAFQFEAAVREQMPQLLDVFGRGRPWQLYDFLMRAEPLLEGRLPLDLLRCGRAHDILRIAKLAATLEHGAH